MDTEIFILEVKGRVHEADHSLLIPGLKICGAIPPLPHICLMDVELPSNLLPTNVFFFCLFVIYFQIVAPISTKFAMTVAGLHGKVSDT
jgi:hypothetical protein